MRIQNQIRKISVALLALTLSSMVATIANAKPATQDVCTRVSGIHMVHFNAYQEKPDPRINFCNDIPNIGETSIIVDLVSPELRKLPIAIHIYNTREDGKKTSVLNMEAKLYPSGLINASVNFSKEGIYIAEVLIEGNTADAPTVKYSVGGGSSVSLHLPRSMMILLALIGGIGLAMGATRVLGMINKKS